MVTKGASKPVKSRGDVAPGKTQTNWRIDNRNIHALEADADRRGFSSIPADLNNMLITIFYCSKSEVDALMKAIRGW